MVTDNMGGPDDTPDRPDIWTDQDGKVAMPGDNQPASQTTDTGHTTIDFDQEPADDSEVVDIDSDTNDNAPESDDSGDGPDLSLDDD